MTLLAAVRGEDEVLVAADSLEFRTVAGYGQTVDKLAVLPDRPVVWGFYGSTTNADRLQVLMGSNGSPGSWDDLSYKYESAILLLDREAWSEGGFGVLFAGWLGGEGGIRAFGQHHRTPDSGDEWCFMGQNRLAAQVGLQISPRSLTLNDRLHLVMSTVVEASAPMLGPPVTGWRVTPNVCEPIWND